MRTRLSGVAVGQTFPSASLVGQTFLSASGVGTPTSEATAVHERLDEYVSPWQTGMSAPPIGAPWQTQECLPTSPPPAYRTFPPAPLAPAGAARCKTKRNTDNPLPTTVARCEKRREARVGLQPPIY